MRSGPKTKLGLYYKEYQRSYYQRNKEKIAAKARRYRQANRPAILAKQAEYRKTDLAKRRKRELRLSSYGLTLEQFESMLLEQSHTCAICKRRRRLHVDHDHSTNRVRGLLCGPCNRLLGLAGDDPEVLSNAEKYLR